MIESTDLGIRYRQSKILVNHAFLKPRHRNPFLRILLARGDNGIFTTLHVEQCQIHFHLAVHDLDRRTRNANLRQPAIVNIRRIRKCRVIAHNRICTKILFNPVAGIRILIQERCRILFSIDVGKCDVETACRILKTARRLPAAQHRRLEF